MCSMGGVTIPEAIVPYAMKRIEIYERKRASVA